MTVKVNVERRVQVEEKCELRTVIRIAYLGEAGVNISCQIWYDVYRKLSRVKRTRKQQEIKIMRIALSVSFFVDEL
jgi:ribosomal protein L18E